MSIVEDLYSSAFKERNRNHFAAIVRVALAGDGLISKQERDFLDRLASYLGISELDYRDILSRPNDFPINPPVSQELRLERLYDLARMVGLDEIDSKTKHKLLRNFVVALGFPISTADLITETAIDLTSHNIDIDTFIQTIRKV